MTKSVLMVLTSCNKHEANGNPTGYWAEEFASPYYLFKEAGLNVVLASPAGGKPPCDPGSLAADFQTDATKRYDSDAAAQQQMASTKKLSEVTADGFDGLFFPGGHGPVYDLYKDATSIALIESFVKANKPVAAVCHGPAALLKACGADGASILKGKKVTGFSNSEEEAVALTKVVPYSLEDELKKTGAEYAKGDDWGVHTEVSGLVITGQNPGSSAETAKKLLAALQ
ncbi:Glutathione-independent glyoxalase HSP31 [Diplonema papillatum]|nr:Glutathione-independent glyoxalase HSP31 [Diplonema papillatum]|eukprot:gene17521-26954_t